MFVIYAYKYAVIGGDLRQTLLLRELSKKNSCIQYGVPEGGRYTETAHNLAQAVSMAEYILLPIPMCKGGRLNIQSESEDFIKETLLDNMKKGQSMFAGCMEPELRAAAQEKGICCYDYMEEQEIAVFNSIATAEGAIAEIISSSPENLHGSRVLVLGYGRCGKTLAAKLKALDAKVSVGARSEAERMEAFAMGCGVEKLSALSKSIGGYKVIINTIPSKLLTRPLLKNLKQGTMVYEIASYPYGVDLEAAEELKIPVRVCAALPAKYAPVSSADILIKFIMERTGR